MSARRRRWRRRWRSLRGGRWHRGAVTGLVALAIGGCGAASPDLFVLTRSGSLPGARLTLLVNDGGTVRCNGGAAKPLSAPLLLDARKITDTLMNDAAKDLVLPAPSGALLRYRYRAQAGTVTFSDVDAARRSELAPVVVFARSVAQQVCGLAR
jgi:hypothetical protein